MPTDPEIAKMTIIVEYSDRIVTATIDHATHIESATVWTEPQDLNGNFIAQIDRIEFKCKPLKGEDGIAFRIKETQK